MARRAIACSDRFSFYELDRSTEGKVGELGHGVEVVDAGRQ